MPLKNPKHSIALKVALSLALLAALWKSGYVSAANTLKSARDPKHLLLGEFLLLCANAVTIPRWAALLKAHKIRVSWLRLTELTLVGCFFNVLLPGGVGGDLVRALMLSKEKRGHSLPILTTVVVDRYLGLFTLVAMAGVALANDPTMLARLGLLSAGWLPAVVVAVVTLFPVYLLWGPPLPLAILQARVSPSRLPARWLSTIAKVEENFRYYRRHPFALLWGAFLSFVGHVFTLSGILALAGALEIPIVSLVGWLTLLPVALALAAIPVFPAAIGTGHAAFGVILGFLGTSSGGDLYTLYAFHLLILALSGWYCYLRSGPGTQNLVKSIENPGSK